MKKKIIISLITGAILAASVIAIKIPEIKAAKNFYANVEALSDEEGGGYSICYSEFKFHLIKRCLRCIVCTYAWGEGLTEGGICVN